MPIGRRYGSYRRRRPVYRRRLVTRRPVYRRRIYRRRR